MSHWLTVHGVWRGGIHWLGDLAGLMVMVIFVLMARPQHRRLVASALVMVGGYSSLADIARTNDNVVAGYHLFFVLLAIVATPVFFKELPKVARGWWAELKSAWRDRGQIEASKQRLREAQAARRVAEARLAQAKQALQEAIRFGDEVEQAKRDHAAGRPVVIDGRVIGHEEIK